MLSFLGERDFGIENLGVKEEVFFFFFPLEIKLRLKQFKAPSLRSVTLYFPTRQASSPWLGLGWGGDVPERAIILFV